MISKGTKSTFRPSAGTECLVSGPNCDDENGYVFCRATILWSDNTFVLYGKPDCWPNLEKWEHVLCRPKMHPAAFSCTLNKFIDDAGNQGMSELDIIAEMEAVMYVMREANRGGLNR